MFYHLALQSTAFHVVLALAIAMIFIVITMEKEKRDERKRA